MPSAGATNLTIQKAAEAAVGFALKAGAKEADALVESGAQFRVDVLEGKVENLKQAQTRGLGLRVFVDKRTALVYTSDLRESALKDVATRAVDLAKKAQADEHAGLPGTPPAMASDEASLKIYDPAVAALTPEQKIAWLREVEKAALAYDPRIKRHDGCSLQSGVGATVYASSAGASLDYRGTQIGGFVNPLADDGDKQQQSGRHQDVAELPSCRGKAQAGASSGQRRREIGRAHV